MKTGKVKWFNNAKGYGFILADDSNEDLFAHYSTIQMDGYRTLKAGQAVQFETKPSDKGTHAINIRALDADTAAHSNSEAPDKRELMSEGA
ncbi:MAG: cold shock domain-containing protein CspD [Saccharospirillaceae bacterium]|nr:cold shock domain-containing protein CspD [Saccharospirillaceae bacterium]MCD8532058.1 cold shock domain-containing protein CspD [Saccharospirillaceae bacterium]